jgi:phage tail sheath gpL-like
VSVAFARISSANRVPGPQAEIDGTNALGLQAPNPHRVLLIGLRLTAGTALQGTVVPIYGATDGDIYFGANSQLAAMTLAYKTVNTAAAVFAMGMDEASGGVAATGSLAFTGTVTANGSCQVRIGDQRVVVASPIGQTATQLVTALTTAITAASRIPMTGVAATGTLNLTARHKGYHGNEVTIEAEILPVGITVTPTQPTGGATNPTTATAIAAAPEDGYDSIVLGWNTGADMLALENEADRRWGPLIKQPVHIFSAVSGTQGALVTYGTSRNSQYSTVIGSGLSPTPFWIWAAQAAARDAQRCDTQNPNRPRNGLTLPNCEAPKKANIMNASQRNLLLYDGISTFKVDQSGRVSIERLICTYQLNSSGQPDATYLAIETMRNLWGIYKECLTLGAKYSDYLLAPDGTVTDSGSPVMTPALMRGEMVALNKSLMARARTKDAAGFETDLICELDPLDPERLNVQIAPRLVGGLVTLALKISFRL